jgi:superkiller protein 3
MADMRTILVCLIPVLVIAAGCPAGDTTPNRPPPRGEMADAIELIASGDYAAAEPLLESLLREHCAEPAQAQHYLGVCAEHREDWPAAEAHYREALRRNPGLFESRYNLGNVLFYEGRNDEALAVFTELTEAFPEEADGFLALGMQQHAMGDGEGALASLRQAVELDGSDVPPPAEQTMGDHPGFVALLEAADVLVELGRPDEALDLRREAVRRAAGSAAPVVALATALVRADRRDEAQAALRDGLAAEPGDPALSFVLGGLLVEEGRCDEALPLLHAALPAYLADDPDGNVVRKLREALAACGAAE